MIDHVLDSSAVLAWIQAEPGGEAASEGALLSAVNLAEVIGKLIDKGYSPGDVLAMARGLAHRIVPLDEELAMATGMLRAQTRAQGLSLGDRACLALAQREGLPALTTDKAWSEVQVAVEIRMLR